MTMLVLGLVLFLGAHSVRIFGEGWRTATVARIGPGAWKGLYSLVSLAGFVLIVIGFRAARADTLVLWVSPTWMRHLTGLLVLLAMVMLVAAYVPRNSIKARLHHPMVLAVKTWAFAHLLAVGALADVVLFGAFLLWAVLDFRSSRQRDRAAGTVYPPGTAASTALTVAGGLIAWSVFALLLHGPLIGVRPFGY